MNRYLTNYGFLTRTSLCLLVVAAPAQSHAETLDDASIRKFYADELAVEDNADTTKDAKKLQALLQERLDDQYVVTTTTTDTIKNGLPEHGKESHNKSETIAMVADNISMTNTETNEDKIINIKYSDDHKYAYINTLSTSSGTMTGPGPDGRPLTLHFQDKLNCVDRTALMGPTLTIMQSTCDDKLVTDK